MSTASTLLHLRQLQPLNKPAARVGRRSECRVSSFEKTVQISSAH
jgi:hypothetical protein